MLSNSAAIIVKYTGCFRTIARIELFIKNCRFSIPSRIWIFIHNSNNNKDILAKITKLACIEWKVMKPQKMLEMTTSTFKQHWAKHPEIWTVQAVSLAELQSNSSDYLDRIKFYKKAKLFLNDIAIIYYYCSSYEQKSWLCLVCE